MASVMHWKCIRGCSILPLVIFYMFATATILPVLVGIPFVGALFLSLGKWSRDFSRWFTLVVKALVFLLSLKLCSDFDTSLDGLWFQFLFGFELWSNWSFYLGIDGISLSLLVLTSFIMLISHLVAWNSVVFKWRAFAINMLLLLGFLLLSFSVLELFVFYLAF